jgi:hypothetical protein
VLERLFASTMAVLIGMTRSDRHQRRETEPSSEHDPPKQDLTFPKRESTILSDPRNLESLFCLSFSRRGLRDLPVFVSQTGGIK